MSTNALGKKESQNKGASKILFVILVIISVFPFISTAMALTSGILYGLIIGNPWEAKSNYYSKKLLQTSVIGLGFGLSLSQVWNSGKSGIIYTIVGITFTLTLGKILGKLLKTDKNTSELISYGTAICGGSAIAAMAPVIKANNEETAVSMATVFTLNSLALLLFPFIGHKLHMTQRMFGLWAAIAIHDTSSVVGAAAMFGATSLAIATTVKLARAFWIAPLAVWKAWLSKSGGKAKFPMFIIGFLAAAAIRSFLPQFSHLWNALSVIAKQGLVITLFLIGTGLSRSLLKKVGIRPLVQGVSLWLIVSSVTLLFIMQGIVK